MSEPLALTDYLTQEEALSFVEDRGTLVISLCVAVFAVMGLQFSVAGVAQHLGGPMARLESDDRVKVPFVMSRTFFSSVLVSLGGWALADSWGLLTSATRVFAYHQGAATLAALYFGVQANEFFFFLKHSSDKRLADDTAAALVACPLSLLTVHAFCTWPAQVGLQLLLVGNILVGELFQIAKNINYLCGTFGHTRAFTTSLTLRLIISGIRTFFNAVLNLWTWYWMYSRSVWDLDADTLPAELAGKTLWSCLVFTLGALPGNMVAFSEFKIAVDISNRLLRHRKQQVLSKDARDKSARKESRGQGQTAAAGDKKAD